MGDAKKSKESVASPSPSATNSHYTADDTVSDDDEIDYETRPEFYDSDLDDKDESWVTKKRKGRSTDAVLSCPACFTTLCLDCQRHEIYVTQYRAMFVVNCEITDKTVVPQGGQKQRKKRKGREFVQAEVNSENEVVRQVCCSVCSTEVGVIDKDEVYHFYDVLPSES